MLKLCVILYFLSLGCWASNEEAGDDDKAQSCPAKLVEDLKAQIARLKAEIVEHNPMLTRELEQLHRELRSLNEQETTAGSDFEKIARRIEELQKRVRGMHWAPQDLPDHFLTVAHLTVREASHDLKNALLVAFLNTLQMSEAATRAERQLIFKSVELNMDLARECLGTIANPTTSPKRLFSVRELFRDLETLLQELPNKVVLTKIRPAVGIAVRASRTQLLRLVQNLVLNAAEAMVNGGTITLSAEITMPPVDAAKPEGPADETVESSSDSSLSVQKGVLVPQNPYVSITVSDNGPGIEKKKVASMLSVKQSTKSAEGGVNSRGIGLSSVMTLALENNGYFELHSELGVGTQARAIFPLVNRKMTEQMEQEINVPSVPGQIVVIDDLFPIRFMISTLLTSCGIPVVTFSSALSALEFCRLHKADVRLILLDQELNDGSTMDSNVDDLRAEGITAPIVAASGNTPPESANVDASLVKPFNFPEFKKLLEKLAPTPPVLP